ncbi:restriction endonuclease subunit S [Pseudomonas yamanorum]
MIFKPLDSLSKIIAGQSPESSTYNSVGNGLPFFQGKADFQHMYPRVRMWCTSPKRKEAEPGDILISVRAPVGAVNICNQKSIIGRGLAALRPSSNLDGKFLYYYLKANERQIDALGTGSTFKAITQDTLKKITIPVPPLEDQIRIANLLGKVEQFIIQRKNNLQQLEDFLNSIFLEMFGDPVRNEKGWDKPELKAFGKISTGNTPPRNNLANYDDNFIEWIKTDNITGKSVFVTPSTEHLSEVGSKKARTTTDGALLVACIAGSIESIGRAALTNRKVSFNQQINAIQPSEDINPLYLYVLFKLSRAYIQSHATKGMKKILTKGDFQQIKMIKPPLDLQNRFASIVEKAEDIKSRYQQSLTDLEALYGALSQQAFKGNLDLSRVPLPDLKPEEVKAVTTDSARTSTEENITINLPDTDNVLDALENAEARKILVAQWLDAYLGQLGTASFSVQNFMTTIQTRLAELLPDNNFELASTDYEYIKTWVFEMITSGKLKQTFDDADNRVMLKAAHV